MSKLKIALVSINQPSLDSASRLVDYLKDYEVVIYGKKDLEHSLNNFKTYEKIDTVLEDGWKKYDAIICILAMGIVVRKIAPLLESKATDPAIIVMSMDLTKIIPLLSGHIGGANELSEIIASRLPNCMNFVSTATDQTNTFAFDMFAKKNSFEIENLKCLAKISNSLLNKKEVEVKTYESIFETISNKTNLKRVDESSNELCVNITPFSDENLTLKPKVYLGIGCNRGTSFEDIEEAFFWFLKKYALKKEQIENIASFEAKADEKGLLEFAKKYSFDIKFYNEKEINSLEKEFSPSQATKFFGLKGVAEPSSILISKYKELIIKKEVIFKKITIAAAV
ncbi:cobalt-precorrin 5A hydrolase [Halarcobacter bivalviorum]|uniref:Cobalamin biosynthesis protein CbiG n=1 Tax=Halarcobacter bivalviorum TaxID=663364 RepID=A0AAX2A9P9_9BACT|nr:cobalamin biosynthesis protein [Halarcobacter bivalviorum]AXH12424.1 cobalt-precorrin 5A hydrolase [Halarcobacter bivalviorum]RXK10650.1 cobalamin biosynthesis protein CbiG [Halarcobacter bivalviorum]